MEDWVGRAQDRSAALRKSQPGRQEAPGKACPLECAESGRNASALVRALWDGVVWRGHWVDLKTNSWRVSVDRTP